MIIRPEAEFQTELPYDAIEDETDIMEFAGRGVTEAISALLTSLGHRVSEPIHAGEHGWELDVWVRGRRFWLQITRMEGADCNLIARVGRRIQSLQVDWLARGSRFASCGDATPPH